MFAQIVDEGRNVVLGNQVTPLPVTLDGSAHTVTRSLEGVAASIAKGARYRLQVIGGSQVYGPVRSAASIQLSSIRLTLPTATASAAPGGSGVLPHLAALPVAPPLRDPRQARPRQGAPALGEGVRSTASASRSGGAPGGCAPSSTCAGARSSA